MEKYDILNKKIVFPAVNGTATFMNTKHKQRLLTALYFINEEAKDSYYRQTSSELELRGPMFNYDRNSLLFPGVARTDGSVPKVVLKSPQPRLL